MMSNPPDHIRKMVRENTQQQRLWYTTRSTSAAKEAGWIQPEDVARRALAQSGPSGPLCRSASEQANCASKLARGSATTAPSPRKLRWADCEDDFDELMSEDDIMSVLRQGLPHHPATRVQFHAESPLEPHPEMPEASDDMTRLGLEIGQRDQGRQALPDRLRNAHGRPTRRGGAKRTEAESAAWCVFSCPRRDSPIWTCE